MLSGGIAMCWTQELCTAAGDVWWSCGLGEKGACNFFAFVLHVRQHQAVLTWPFAKNAAGRRPMSYHLHHECAQIPYSDITRMYLAPHIKISGHIHGGPKCQISLKLPCFLIPVSTTSNILRCRTLTDIKYMAFNGLLCRIQCAEACDRPEGSYGCIRFLPL